LSEALGNLIDNAVRCTTPGGRILISVSAAPALHGAAVSLAQSDLGGANLTIRFR